jgi:hypothetical protein
MVARKGTEGLTTRGRAMQRLLGRWERSGLTLAESARRAGMPPGTLAWWRHTLRAGERTPAKGKSLVGEFLDYFMVRKVIAGRDLLRAAGTVTKKLARWLAAKGYAAGDDVEEAAERGAAAARDLPQTDELASLLYHFLEDEPRGRMRDVYPA